jgi:hypothetical protein
MRVYVQAISPQGFPELASPSMHRRMTEGPKPVPMLDNKGEEIWDPGEGRFFPTAKPGREVEVLEQDEDPTEIEIEVPNGTTGRQDKVKRPDPARMGRKSYQAILDDQRFRVVQTENIDSRAADASVAAARAEVSRLAAALSDAKVALATLQSEHDALKDEHAEVVAQLEAATAPAPVQAPTETKGGPPSAPTTTVQVPGKETPPSA